MARLRALRGRTIPALQNGKAIAVESGHVKARAFRIDLDKRVMQVVYRVGGMTDTGEFVHDAEYPDIVVTVNGTLGKRDLWERTMAGRTSFDLDQLSQLAATNPKIKGLARMFWNVDLDDVEEDV
jgi:hypothetical protein